MKKMKRQKLNKLYEFNRHGVCKNPDFIIIKDFTKVEVCCNSIGSWSFGFTAPNGGFPCMLGIKTFSSKDDAIKAGLNSLILWLKSDISWYVKAGSDYSSDLRRAKELLKLAEDKLRNMLFVQLELF